MTVAVGTDAARLRLEVRIKPENRAAADKELPPDHAPFEFGLLPGDGDEYVVTSGGMKGARLLHPRPARRDHGRRPGRPAVQPDPDGLAVNAAELNWEQEVRP